ncbi:hypothetical protein RQP46_002516 [Phenoliferia psychrophenolica]
MARAPFSTLPLELKEMIVQMASDQEDAYKGRVKDPRERAGHINGLRALALVNKELSELTARHRFRVLLAGRVELRDDEYSDNEETFFETVILPRHAHHMRAIVFKSTDADDAAKGAIEIIGQLPALQSLDFDEGSAMDLFDGARFESFWQRDGTFNYYDYRDHKYIALKIETLVLRGSEPAWTMDFARAFTNLSLSIQLDREACANQWSTSLEALAPLLLDPPPIKTLHLLLFPLQCIPLIASIFASSLETLCIYLRDQDDISPEELELLSDLSDLTPVQLPLLTSLTISSEYASDLNDISRLLLSSSSALSELVCKLDDITLDPTDKSSAPLLRLLDSQPSLRRVQLGTPPTPLVQDPLPLSFIAAYTTLIHSRNLDPSVLDDPSVARFYKADAVECTANEAEVLEVALRRTLAFATEELERLVAEGKMANDQEDAFKERVTSLAERASHINSLSSLALVNRELSELTARHRFKVLFAGRTEMRDEEYSDNEETFFETTILPRHAHHMKEIVFKDKDDEYAAKGAMDIIDRLPALRSLDFEEGQASKMFDGLRFDMFFQRNGSLTYYDSRHHTSIALKIETLVLRGFEPWQAFVLSRSFTNLNIFSSTLETLCLHLRDQDDITPEELEELDDLPSIIPVQSPLLTSLTISSEYSSDLNDISRLLLSSSTLTELVCKLNDITLDPTNESSAPLLRLLDSQPSLHRVELGRPPVLFPHPHQDLRGDPLPLSFIAAYTTLVHSRDLDPSVLDDPTVARFCKDDDVECTESEAEVLKVALRRTLAFAMEELERLDAEGKVGSVVGWVEALRPVEERRLAWRD